MIPGSIMIGFDLMPDLIWLYFIILGVTATGIFAVRALYFAIMEKGDIPLIFTGTTTGIISVVGYTPEIFMGPLMGYYLDTYPGEEGHQYVFILLMLFSIVGLIAAIAFHRRSIQKSG